MFAVVSFAEAVDHHDNNNDGNNHDNNNCRDDGDQNSHEVVALICEIKKGGERGGEKGEWGRERKGKVEGRRGVKEKRREGKGGRGEEEIG